MAVATPKIVKELRKDIEATINALRADSLLRDEAGVSLRPKKDYCWEITYPTKDRSGSIIYDKNITYAHLINELLVNRQYTILLYDRSIVQAEFIVQGDEIIKERLIFLKKHNVIWNRDEINEYEANDEDWFDNINGIPLIFRIDHDKGAFEDTKHPKTHFTLSNHESCRVPVKGIVTFSEFMKLIMHNFYDIDLCVPEYRFTDETITDNERMMIHFNWK